MFKKNLSHCKFPSPPRGEGKVFKTLDALSQSYSNIKKKGGFSFENPPFKYNYYFSGYCFLSSSREFFSALICSSILEKAFPFSFAVICSSSSIRLPSFCAAFIIESNAVCPRSFVCFKTVSNGHFFIAI